MMLLEPETFTSLLQSTHFSVITIMTIGYEENMHGNPCPRYHTLNLMSSAMEIMLQKHQLAGCSYAPTYCYGSLFSPMPRPSSLVRNNRRQRCIGQHPPSFSPPTHTVAVIEMRPAKTRTIADQKQVIFSTLGFLAALLVVGASAYSFFEGQSFVNGFYWVVITLSTVGYGDITPTHTSSRWFSMIYDFFGVILFAVRWVVHTSPWHVRSATHGLAFWVTVRFNAGVDGDVGDPCGAASGGAGSARSHAGND